MLVKTRLHMKGKAKDLVFRIDNKVEGERFKTETKISETLSKY